MVDAEDKKDHNEAVSDSASSDQAAVSIERGELVNASGHVQQLDRNFNLLTLAGVGLVVGNVWPAVGGSILVAIFNGGPPGILDLCRHRGCADEFQALSMNLSSCLCSIGSLQLPLQNWRQQYPVRAACIIGHRSLLVEAGDASLVSLPATGIGLPGCLVLRQ